VRGGGGGVVPPPDMEIEVTEKEEGSPLLLGPESR